MAADMAEQPDVLRRLIAARSRLHRDIRRLTPTPLRGIALVGRGSSENAALYGRSLLETLTHVPATLVPASMVRLYGGETDMDGHLAVALSQSGRTADVVETLEALGRHGAVTVALTTDPASPLGGVADLVLDLQTGPERAVPATKTFTAELATLAMIGEAFGATDLFGPRWPQMVDAVEDELQDQGCAGAAAARLHGIDQLSIVAAGLLVAVANEGALKLRETALVAASGWSSAEFHHGPIAIVGPSHPVILIAHSGRAGDEVLRIREELPDVPTITIATTPNADLRLPSHLPEPLAAIPAAVRAQQLALETARRRGLDPDQPPRIRKVTLV